MAQMAGVPERAFHNVSHCVYSFFTSYSGTLERAFEAEGAVKLVMVTPGSGKWQPSALEVRQKGAAAAPCLHGSQKAHLRIVADAQVAALAAAGGNAACLHSLSSIMFILSRREDSPAVAQLEA